MCIASAIELGELHAGTGSPDVVIERGTVVDRWADARDPGTWFEVAGNVVLLRFEDMRFLVERGERIRIDAPSDKLEADIRIWLLGTVMAALLYQRGVLPLHANVVALDEEEAVAFAGPSGAGKSTLAAWFEQSGRSILGDDLCAVRFNDLGGPVVYQGIPRVKLWQSSLDFLGRSSCASTRVASDLEKFHVPLTPIADRQSLAARRLRRVYLLDQAETPDEPLITRVDGALAATAVLQNVFRWQLGKAIGGGRGAFDQCLAVARQSACFRVSRRFSLANFEEEAAAIARHLDQRLTKIDAVGGGHS